MKPEFKKFEQFENKLQELEQNMSDPAVISDPQKIKQYSKEHSEYKEKVEKFREYKKLLSDIDNVSKMINSEKDDDLKDLAQEELRELALKQEKVEFELKAMLIPKDPFADRNTIVEIRAGTGGEEASLFVGELFRMYTRYAERKNWKMEMIDAHATELGGYKEVIFQINGANTYGCLKFESGVHRVQRVPLTEAGGRIHTSAVTVAVLPEAQDVDIEIKNEDLRLDTFCASGKGGQSVNTTYSAVRITHLPTNFVVQCQDERSQIKNKAKAMKILKSRLLKKYQDEQDALIAKDRKQQIGSGDRSEKIRTYNFPQDRVTDHRVSYTRHNINGFMDGDIDDVVKALVAQHQQEMIEEM
jgi:peptide chain release factor 1